MLLSYNTPKPEKPPGSILHHKYCLVELRATCLSRNAQWYPLLEIRSTPRVRQLPICWRYPQGGTADGGIVLSYRVVRTVAMETSWSRCGAVVVEPGLSFGSIACSGCVRPDLSAGRRERITG